VPHAVSPRHIPPRVAASGTPPADAKFECVPPPPLPPHTQSPAGAQTPLPHPSPPP
jgi:hypothetical protein